MSRSALRYILPVETRFPGTVLYRREEGSEEWEALTFEAMADRIDLPAIGASLDLAGIDEDMVFEAGRAPPR